MLRRFGEDFGDSKLLLVMLIAAALAMWFVTLGAINPFGAGVVRALNRAHLLL